MGVETVAVSQPVSGATRRQLRAIERVDPIQGKVEGAGPAFAFSHNTNAALTAVNDILAAGGAVTFAKTEPTIYTTGHAGLLRKNGVNATSLKEAPDGWPVKKPRIALYEPWMGNIDEGWTRWILEQHRFPFTRVHNPDIQSGPLRQQYDTIVIAEMAARQISYGTAAA